MEEISIEGLYLNYRRKLQRVPLTFKRYIYSQINWDNWVIGIKGERGVGKTTLILQHIKETFDDKSKALYVSLDNIWFSTHPLSELVEYFYTHGGTHLFLDEVHKYANWQTILKNLCDDYPDIHIVYTSSSMLRIDYGQGDMSRRQIVYDMKGLSFREYLEFEGIGNLPAIGMPELLKSHVDIAMDITYMPAFMAREGGTAILSAFSDYLNHGYYPFFKRDGDGFGFRLQEVVNQVLESDLPAVEDVSYATIRKAMKMLMMLAERVPNTPKMSELYKELETTRDHGLKILYALESAGLLGLVSFQPRSLRVLSRPDKILIGNSNLMYSLTEYVDKGAMREAFFHNQTSAVHDVLLSRQGDFLIDRKHIFEVGGRGKTFGQVRDLPDSYLAVDDTETGHGARIPLWMFGLLY